MRARNAWIAVALAAAFGWAAPAAAHCDTLDGPVVGAAKAALASGEVERALIWVQKRDEGTIRTAFAKARSARDAGGQATADAELAFYATLVRVHREGEGAPYTGLKPAGEIEPPILAADRALVTGMLADVETPVVERVREGIAHRYDAVASRRSYAATDVAAGRAYVGAYVDYVHYVERLYAATAPQGGEGTVHDHATAHDSAAAHAH